MRAHLFYSSLHRYIVRWSQGVPTAPNPATLVALSNFFNYLEENNQLQNVQHFNFLAADYSDNSLVDIINLIQGSYVGYPTFTAGRGPTMNGTTQYFKPNWIPNSTPNLFTLNSGSVGLYNRTTTVSGGHVLGACDAGSTNLLNMVVRFTGNLFYGYCNTNGAAATGACPSAQGLWQMNRVANNSTICYKDGASTYTSAALSSALAAKELYVGALNNNGTASNFHNGQYSIFYIGNGSLNADIFNIGFQTLKTAIGF